MELDVAVIVVTYNSESEIAPNVASLDRALGDLTWSLRIVDNGSQDGTLATAGQLVRDVPDGQVLPGTNVGYSAGINRGVAASPPSRTVLVLNPDVRLDEGSVVRMLSCLGETGAGIVVPLLRDEEGRRSDSLRRTPSLGRASGLAFTRLAALSEYVTDEASYRGRHRVDWATGAVMMVDRRVHDELGGWDESFFLYSEETDLCLRAADVGRATYFEPSASALHVGGGSGRNDRTHVMQIVNKVRLYARRHSAVQGWLYWGLTILSECSWILRGHPQSKASVRALFLPGSRPAEIGCPDRLPR